MSPQSVARPTAGFRELTPAGKAVPGQHFKELPPEDLWRHFPAGSFKEHPIQTEHPDLKGDFWDKRHLLMNTVVPAGPDAVKRWMDKEGYESHQLEGNHYALRRPGGKWHVIDEPGLTGRDIGDLAGEALMVGGMALTGGTAGGVLGAAGRTAAVTGATELGIQGAGAGLLDTGVKPGEALGAAAETGVGFGLADLTLGLAGRGINKVYPKGWWPRGKPPPTPPRPVTRAPQPGEGPPLRPQPEPPPGSSFGAYRPGRPETPKWAAEGTAFPPEAEAFVPGARQAAEDAVRGTKVRPEPSPASTKPQAGSARKPDAPAGAKKPAVAPSPAEPLGRPRATAGPAARSPFERAMLAHETNVTSGTSKPLEPMEGLLQTRMFGADPEAESLAYFKRRGAPKGFGKEEMAPAVPGGLEPEQARRAMRFKIRPMFIKGTELRAGIEGNVLHRMRKPEVVEIAKDWGVDATGSKERIIQRLAQVPREGFIGNPPKRAYDPEKYGIRWVWDLDSRNWRSIGLDSVEYMITKEQGQRVVTIARDVMRYGPARTGGITPAQPTPTGKTPTEMFPDQGAPPVGGVPPAGGGGLPPVGGRTPIDEMSARARARVEAKRRKPGGGGVGMRPLGYETPPYVPGGGPPGLGQMGGLQRLATRRVPDRGPPKPAGPPGEAPPILGREARPLPYKSRAPKKRKTYTGKTWKPKPYKEAAEKAAAKSLLRQGIEYGGRRAGYRTGSTAGTIVAGGMVGGPVGGAFGYFVALAAQKRLGPAIGQMLKRFTNIPKKARAALEKLRGIPPGSTQFKAILTLLLRDAAFRDWWDKHGDEVERSTPE